MAFLMAVTHFLGEELEEYLEGYREQILSFGSGVSITYIFVQLLPEFHNIAVDTTQVIFIFPLLGFSSIHLLEKYIARSGLSAEEMTKDYGRIHSGFLFIYSIAIGYLIASLVARDAVTGLLFFLPIIIHVAVSSVSISELHEEFIQKLPVKIIISLAPILGVFAYRLGNFTSQQFNPVFGTIIGMFFYIVIRDSIPQGDHGRPGEFMLGIIIYLIVIFAASTI